MEYFKRNNKWYYTDKSGKNRKVTSVKKLDELNNSIDLTDVKPEKTIDGLGDLVSSVTSKLGIEECGGCVERKKLFNKFLPFLVADTSVVTEEDIILINRIDNSNVVTSSDVDKLYSLYNRLFKRNKKRQNCPGCVKTIFEQIKKKLDI